jgi:enoyl-CoA hydratase
VHSHESTSALASHIRATSLPVQNGHGRAVDGQPPSVPVCPTPSPTPTPHHRSEPDGTGGGLAGLGRTGVAYAADMIEYESQDHVAVVTINRPEARNAVNAEVASGIEEAIDRMEADDDVWVGVLTGAGPVFCAGADLKAVASGQAGGLSTQRGGFGGIVARERSKPLIAAVDGPALAGGTEIVLSCDLVVASTESRFGVPEVKRSLVAAAGGLFRLPQKLPRNVALEMVLTGDPISAERAHHFGLVNVLCAQGEALSTALDLARRITVNAPLAVRESLGVVNAARGLDDAEALRLSNAAMGRLAATEDFGEGPRAFIEKREPRWTGR